MCELFGYSGDREHGLANWLMPFRARGGGGDNDNPDGWGVASWRGQDANVVKSPEPGFSSEQFAQLAAGLHTRLAIAHVRKARHPPVAGMLNTHPFAHGHDRLHHLEFDDARGRRSIVATEALTDDAWQPFSPGELRVYRDGTLLA